MSLYNDASLVMIPSAYKDGKLYSIKPTDGSGDFTFSRGSNLAATRVDENGLIEKGRENLLLQSNQFDTTWTKSNVSVTSGQSGYDGSSDAWLLQALGTTSYLIQNISASNGYVYTQSIYAKSGNTDFISLTFGSGMSTKYAIFNLSNGSIDTDTGFIDSTIQSVGSGWYRCSISVSSSTTGSNGGLIATPSRSGASRFAAVVGDNVLIQSAQTEAGLVATDYIETTTTTAQAGILEDMPRLDYSGGASCPSLLLEPTRTNLITNSEYFGSGSGWNSISTNVVNVTNNYAISPEGLKNASKLEFNGNNSWLAKSVSAISGNDYSASVYLKVADGQNNFNVTLSFYPTGGGVRLDKVVTLTSEWQRFDALYENVIPGTGVSFFVIRSDGDNIGCLAYGAQFEQASYPSSYIPTYGSAVTRSGELYQKTSATDIIGQSQGSIYLEITQNGLPSYTQRILSISDGTSNNSFEFQLTPSNVITFVSVADGVASAIISKSSATTEGVKLKIAVGYAENDFVLYIDGVQVGTDNSGAVPSTSLIKNDRPTGGTLFVGEVHQVLLYKTRLTNGELAALTTI